MTQSGRVELRPCLPDERGAARSHGRGGARAAHGGIAARVRVGPGVRRGERYSRRDEVGLRCAVAGTARREAGDLRELGIGDGAAATDRDFGALAAGRRDRSAGSAGHGENGDGRVLGEACRSRRKNAPVDEDRRCAGLGRIAHPRQQR